MLSQKQIYYILFCYQSCLVFYYFSYKKTLTHIAFFKYLFNNLLDSLNAIKMNDKY